MRHAINLGTVVVLAVATLAGPAFADNDRRGDRDRNGYSHRGNEGRGHDRRDDRRDDRRHDRRDDRRDERRYSQHRYEQRDRHDRYGRYDRHYAPPVRVVHVPPRVVYRDYGPRYAAPPPRWARGGYVHRGHRPVYVVNDYNHYGLRHPPRGYRWMRDDVGDYLLVAIATGIIADIIFR
ncbi:RcnB family protein [Luteimonas sp. RIT-PG2_3]